MAMTIDELEAEALKMPEKSRALLAERLVASLKDWDAKQDGADHAEIERLQQETVQKRYRDILEGRVKTVSGPDVLARAKDMFRKQKPSSWGRSNT